MPKKYYWPPLSFHKSLFDHSQDGKPYILSIRAGHAFPDQRAQGYTVAIFSVFASKEDMEYYDNECEAHKALKVVAKEVHQGIMTIYFESIFD